MVSLTLVVIIILVAIVVYAIYRLVRVNSELKQLDKDFIMSRQAIVEMDKCGWSKECIEEVAAKYKDNALLQKCLKKCLEGDCD